MSVAGGQKGKKAKNQKVKRPNGSKSARGPFCASVRWTNGHLFAPEAAVPRKPKNNRALFCVRLQQVAWPIALVSLCLHLLACASEPTAPATGASCGAWFLQLLHALLQTATRRRPPFRPSVRLVAWLLNSVQKPCESTPHRKTSSPLPVGADAHFMPVLGHKTYTTLEGANWLWNRCCRSNNGRKLTLAGP